MHHYCYNYLCICCSYYTMAVVIVLHSIQRIYVGQRGMERERGTNKLLRMVRSVWSTPALCSILRFLCAQLTLVNTSIPHMRID